MFGFGKKNVTKDDFRQFLETWQQTEVSRRKEDQQQLQTLVLETVAQIQKGQAESDERKTQQEREKQTAEQQRTTTVFEQVQASQREEFMSFLEAWRKAENTRGLEAQQEKENYALELHSRTMALEQLNAAQREEFMSFLEAWRKAENVRGLEAQQEKEKYALELHSRTMALEQLNAAQREEFRQFLTAWQEKDFAFREAEQMHLQKIVCESIDYFQYTQQQMVERQQLQERMNIEADQYKAAVALNMCMVSLSQIVDYNDINILKLEYEAILNNLNLENMIKDEALLDALKQILDTCHFYILHEKDKDILKKKQAAKLKNVLGNSLGGKGGVIALFGTPNPWTIVATATVMVGAAAVNYKTQKAQVKQENEEEEWQLQRSALEQLHNLRRALFETAWRLADTYKFDDKHRLTEKQISIYNNILQEPDPQRRYERLEHVCDQFDAYPLLSYYKAHAALAVAERIKHENPRNHDIWRQKALDSLHSFTENHRKCKLLREDVVAAAAYLDKVELLGDSNPEDREKCIDDALELAGTDLDIIQIGVFQYLRLNAPEARTKAVKHLKFLVSENHNIFLNANALSRIYIELGNKDDYDILAGRIMSLSAFPNRHILPWNSGISTGIAVPMAVFLKEKTKDILKCYLQTQLQLEFKDFFLAIKDAARECTTAPVLELQKSYVKDKYDLVTQRLLRVWKDFREVENAGHLFIFADVDSNFSKQYEALQESCTSFLGSLSTDTSERSVKTLWCFRTPVALENGKECLSQCESKMKNILAGFAELYAKTANDSMLKIWSIEQKAINEHKKEVSLAWANASEEEKRRWEILPCYKPEILQKQGPLPVDTEDIMDCMDYIKIKSTEAEQQLNGLGISFLKQ